MSRRYHPICLYCGLFIWSIGSGSQGAIQLAMLAMMSWLMCLCCYREKCRHSMPAHKAHKKDSRASSKVGILFLGSVSLLWSLLMHCLLRKIETSSLLPVKVKMLKESVIQTSTSNHGLKMLSFIRYMNRNPAAGNDAPASTK